LKAGAGTRGSPYVPLPPSSRPPRLPSPSPLLLCDAIFGITLSAGRGASVKRTAFALIATPLMGPMTFVSTTSATGDVRMPVPTVPTRSCVAIRGCTPRMSPRKHSHVTVRCMGPSIPKVVDVRTTPSPGGLKVRSGLGGVRGAVAMPVPSVPRSSCAAIPDCISQLSTRTGSRFALRCMDASIPNMANVLDRLLWDVLDSA
jgi:hypothetical protein